MSTCLSAYDVPHPSIYGYRRWIVRCDLTVGHEGRHEHDAGGPIFRWPDDDPRAIAFDESPGDGQPRTL